jgi:hypothetical protein
MASQAKSFEDLVKESPSAPAAGTVSLVGTLSQSPEAGKFVLTLEDGRGLTMETSAVSGHTVLGSSVGRTVVRVDVEASKVPATVAGPAGAAGAITTVHFLDQPITNPDIDHPFTVARFDYTVAWLDHIGTLPAVDYYVAGPGNVPPGWPVEAGGGGVAPFALATPQQAPASTMAALQGQGVVTTGIVDHPNTGIADQVTTGIVDQPHTGVFDNIHTGVWDRKFPVDDGATNVGSRYLD